MLYLGSLRLPNNAEEFSSMFGDGHSDPGNYKSRMTCYENHYPFGMFPERVLEYVEFAPITIFAGGNGSGKSTLLNVIAEKLRLGRSAPFNSTPFFRDYIRLCRVNDGEEAEIPRQSRIITSDDVFQAILSNRRINERRDRERDELIREYWDGRKKGGFRLQSLEETDALKRYNHLTRAKATPSKFVNEYLSRPAEEASNGECALEFFTNAIGEDSLYLLDEPENSLSPVFQMRLVSFLEEAVRFYGCQLVIATHSPILLSMRGARIYDMDARPVSATRWTELENVRLLYDFFAEHRDEFE